MTVVVLGYKSHSINDAPACIYCGGSGVEADAANAAARGYLRRIKLVNPHGIPMPSPAEDLAPVAAEASTAEEPQPVSNSKKTKK